MQIYRKSENHADMNEHLFLQIYLARSHIEMKHSEIEIWIRIVT